MKKLQLLLNLIFTLLIVGLFAFQFTKDDKIAFVNSARLMEQYEGMKAADKELSAQSAVWQKNVDTLSLELEQAIKQYEKDLNRTSAKEQKAFRETIGRKQNELLQYQEVVRQKKEQEDQRVIGNVLKEINSFLSEYGKQHHYKVILSGSKGTVAYADESIDITEEVIVQLNKKYRGE